MGDGLAGRVPPQARPCAAARRIGSTSAKKRKARQPGGPPGLGTLELAEGLAPSVLTGAGAEDDTEKESVRPRGLTR